MDITTIVQHAKDMLLEHGRHQPMLLIESNQGREVLVLMEFPDTTLEKQLLLFSTGRQYGINSVGKTLSQIVFLSEAWVSEIPKQEYRKRKHARPSDDPKRKEALIVVILDCVPPKLKHSMHMVEMIRDGAGNLVDLLPRSDPMMDIQSMLLPAFLAGFTSASMSDEQLGEMMRARKEHNAGPSASSWLP